MKKRTKNTVFISIMGTLGCGKTTMATLLSEKLKFSLFTEQYQENPFLPKFYGDMERWAFHSQMFFLLEKARQYDQIKALLKNNSVIQDTPIYQDVFSYALAQHDLKNMSRIEWDLYQKLFTTLLPNLPKPDLIIYIDATVPTIMKRIESRRRAFETDIPETYITLLHELNTKWLNENTKIPVLTISTENKNVARNESDRSEVVALVAERVHKI